MRLTPEPDDLHRRIGAVTREIRKREGLTLAEVARRGEFGASYPGRVERGEADPRVSQLTRLARALGLNGAEELMQAAEFYRPRRDR
jgi:transcriptional regulator with XRE-family HTH domain